MHSENIKNGYSQEEILSCLYDMQYRCPCCDVLFSERAVKEEKLSFCGQDTDFRKYYEPVDPLLYEIVCCTNCGYASLGRTFDGLSFKGAQIVSAVITPKFKYNNFPQIYSYDTGAMRYKAAIVTALAIREKTVEIAYLYMKLAWIYRACGDAEMETSMMSAAFEGMLESMRKGLFPFAELTELNALCIMADYLFKTDNKEDAKLFYSIIDKRNSVNRNDTANEISKWVLEHPISKL